MNLPTQRIEAGHLIVHLLETLERAGVPSVYLRNYENLPSDVGNDVDLLVPFGKRRAAVRILIAEARSNGWHHLGSASFSPLAIYFANPETTETLHIDLFDRLEWHFLEFADASAVLARRHWNGLVHVPESVDETYQNVVGRLAYQGVIREKHQQQVTALSAEGGMGRLRETFQVHLGKPGLEVFEQLEACNWTPEPGVRAWLLRAAAIKYALVRPHRAFVGWLRYIERTLGKLLKPPGRFIVFEGADGVGKSTVLNEIIPWMASWCGGRQPYRFHWKPTKTFNDPSSSEPSVDPRGKPLRPPLPSLVFLIYHVAGFWWGWFHRLYPQMVRGHLVVGDRYSFDLYLDPQRFRLKLPASLCRAAAVLSPRPGMTIGLVADPETIRCRKPELSAREIAAYQERWHRLSNGKPRMATVSADGTPEEVIRRVKQAIIMAVTYEDARNE